MEKEDFDRDIHGNLLIIDWKGVDTPRYASSEEQAEYQRKVEQKHIKQLKVWRKQAMKDNVAPF